MKKNTRPVCLFVLMLVLAAQQTFAQSLSGKTGIEAKVALESSLENRLKKVLTEIAGTQDIIVIVSVELAREQAKSETKKQDDFILPGVPIREAISEKSVQSAVMSALGEDTRTLIRRLKATVIVDKSVSSETEKIIRDVAAGLLGIDETRGDQFIIQKMSFRRQSFSVASLFYPPNLFWLVAVVAFAFAAASLTAFLAGPGRDFSKNLVAAIRMQAEAVKDSASSKENPAETSIASPEITPEAIKGAPAPDRPSADSRPFSFINAANLPALQFLLKTAPASVSSAVLGYLDDDLAAEVFSRLSPEKRREAAQLLVETRELPAAETSRVEEEIKKRISYVVGGAGRIAALAENTDEKIRGEILSSVAASSAEKAAEVRKSMATVELLVSADTSVLNLVIKQLGGSSFAQILKGFSEENREKILSTLAPGAAARIRQEMELAKTLSAARAETEKKRLVALLKRLRAKGFLEI